MKRTVCVLVAIVFLVMAGSAWAQERASAAQAKMWADKAEKYVKEHGLKAAAAEFNKPAGQFVKGELYVAVATLDGLVLAYPTQQKMVGKLWLDLKDPEGKFIMKEMMNIAKTKGQGWLDYKIINPVTKKMEQKTSYVKKVADNAFLTVGAYK